MAGEFVSDLHRLDFRKTYGRTTYKNYIPIQRLTNEKMSSDCDLKKCCFLQKYSTDHISHT